MVSFEQLDLKKKGVFYIVYENSKIPIKDTISILQKLAVNQIKGVYISLNKAVATLDKIFRIDNKFSNIVCYISPFSIASESDNYNVIGIKSAQSLSEILFGVIEITKLYPTTDFLIIDSFDAIMAANSPDITYNFLYQLNQMMKELSYINFLLVVNSSRYESQLRDILSFADEEITIGG